MGRERRWNDDAEKERKKEIQTISLAIVNQSLAKSACHTDKDENGKYDILIG